jgi:hypothetical protein
MDGSLVYSESVVLPMGVISSNQNLKKGKAHFDCCGKYAVDDYVCDISCSYHLRHLRPKQEKIKTVEL